MLSAGSAVGIGTPSLARTPTARQSPSSSSINRSAESKSTRSSSSLTIDSDDQRLMQDSEVSKLGAKFDQVSDVKK